MGYQWNWGVFLQPSASGDDTYLGWMFAGFKMTIALSLSAWVLALLLGRYSWSSIGEIHGRIGEEIPRRRLRTMLQLMCEQTAIQKAGELKARRYALPNAVLLTKPPSN